MTTRKDATVEVVERRAGLERDDGQRGEEQRAEERCPPVEPDAARDAGDADEQREQGEHLEQ